MCGFVTVSSNNPNHRFTIGDLRSMQSKISHRGPDDSGLIFIDENQKINDAQYFEDQKTVRIGLAFHRLSIMDISMDGHQPMISNCARYVIVFNGEIYNFKELRKEYFESSDNFKSSSDTEVILNLYIKYGPKMLELLNGMFSICIFDLKENLFFLARDRLGIKPLYYYYDDSTFIAASEIKPFLRYPGFKFELNGQKFSEYLCFRYIAGEQTLYKNIYECSPGTYMIFKNGKISKHRYWQLSESDPIYNLNEGKSKLIEELRKSINYQLISDVEIGTQLSGGIDSSLIANYAFGAKMNYKKSFSISVNDEDHNEEEYIRYVNEKYSLDSYNLPMYQADLIENLNDVTYSFDHPISHPNSVGIFLLAREASKYVKVVLSGEGADEIFGGYDRYYLARILSNLGQISYFINNLRNKGNRRDGYNLIEILILLSSYSRISEVKEIYNDFNYEEAMGLRKKIFKKTKNSYFESYLTYEQSTYLPELLLRQDKMCMAHGIENRVPFLDHNIVEFSKKISSNLKTNFPIMPLKGNSRYNTKYILKNISENIFNKNFTYRNKIGFSLPLNKIFKNKKFYDYFSYYAKFLNENGVLNRKIENNFFTEENLNISDNMKWTLLTFSVWLKNINDQTKN